MNEPLQGLPPVGPVCSAQEGEERASVRGPLRRFLIRASPRPELFELGNVRGALTPACPPASNQLESTLNKYLIQPHYILAQCNN